MVVVVEEENSELYYHPSQLIQEGVKEVLDKVSYHHNLFWKEAWDPHPDQVAFRQSYLFPEWEFPQNVHGGHQTSL